MPKALVALLVGILTLFLAESLCRVGVFLAQPSESHVREFDHKWALAHGKPTNDLPVVLFLGDSYTSRAIYPELMMSHLKQKGFPLKVMNLGSTSNTPKMSLALLQEAVKSGWKPNLVVYGLSPRLFNHSYIQNREANGQAQFEDSYLGRCKARKPSGWEKLDCQLKKSFFLLRYQKYWSAQLKQLPNMLEHTSQYLQDGGVAKAVHEISPQGWSPGYVVYTPSEYEGLMSTRGKNGPHNLETAKILFGDFQWDDGPFRELQAYCAKNKLPLLLVWYPENPVRENYYRMSHLSGEMFGNNFSKLAQANNNWYLDLHNQDQDASHFYNTDHLNVLGAITLTQRLGEVLSRNPYSSLWSSEASRKVSDNSSEKSPESSERKMKSDERRL